MNSKFPSATSPIIFNTPLASSLLGRTVVGISSRLVEMEGTSLMSLSVIESLPTSLLSPMLSLGSTSSSDLTIDSLHDGVGGNQDARLLGGTHRGNGGSMDMALGIFPE
jgi:hypothetical protein